MCNGYLHLLKEDYPLEYYNGCDYWSIYQYFRIAPGTGYSDDTQIYYPQ
jgi:hypothetical protein